MKECKSCGSQNDPGSDFCRNCGSNLAATDNKAEQPPQYPPQAYPPQPPYPTSPYQSQTSYIPEQNTQGQDHRYKKLGGWLMVVVVANMFGVIYDAFVSITGLAETIELFELRAYLPESFEAALFMTLVGQIVGLLTVVFTILFIVQVFQRKPTFLRFHQLGLLAGVFYALFAGLIPNIMIIDYVEVENIPQNIGVIVGSIIGLFLFALYMSKSLRVRIYMGSDEYMEKALVAFKNQPPIDYNNLP